MDRKNHIVAPDGGKEQARAFVPYATESFLTTLANKGLYKRALKDLETVERIELAPAAPPADGGLRVVWDDVEVSLATDVAQSRCNCPSRTVCKHILMAILAVAEYAADEAADGTEPPVTPVAEAAPAEGQEPWSELRRIDPAELRKQAGKKTFDEALRLIREGWGADLKEGEMLEATLNSEPITVYFPRRNSLSGAVCKCGATGLCKHKLLAVLSYLNDRNGLNVAPDEPEPLLLLDDRTVALLEAADRFVVRVLTTGAVHCDETQAEAAMRYSLHLESCAIGNLARLFRSLATDIENRLEKHVDFDRLSTLSTLSRLHNTLRLVLANRQDGRLLAHLIESPRSDYRLTPVGHFTALGAAPWQTRSGYFGITAYFFYHERQIVCTYTTTLADYYEKTEHLATLSNLTRQYRQTTIWNEGIPLSTLSRSEFTLRNFKLNDLRRLSSSSQTQCRVIGTVDRRQIASLSALHAAATREEDEPIFDYFRPDRLPRLTVVPFDGPIRGAFDRTEQVLCLTLRSTGNEPIEAFLPYGEMSRQAIQYLESRYDGPKPDRRTGYAVCRYGAEGEPVPVSLVDDDGIVNFFFS